MTLGFHYFSFFSIQYFTVKILGPFKLPIPTSWLPEYVIPSSPTGICNAQHRPLTLLGAGRATARGEKGRSKADFWDGAGMFSFNWHPNGIADRGYLHGYLVAVELGQFQELTEFTLLSVLMSAVLLYVQVALNVLVTLSVL